MPTLKGRPCSVCTHPQAREIATALLAGGTCRDVAKRYGLPLSTLARHNRLHLSVRIARAETAAGVPAPAPNAEPGSIQAEAAAVPRVKALEAYEATLDVMRAMRELHQRTLALLDKAEASDDLHVALRAVREARGNLELLGRLDGSLDGPVTASSGPVNIVVTYVDKAVMLPSAAPPMLEGETD